MTANHLPRRQKISHSHPASGVLPPVPAAETPTLASLVWGLALQVCRLSGPILSEDFIEDNCLARGEECLWFSANPNDRIPSDGSDPVPPVNRLVERVRHHFDRRPELAREKFLLEAVPREIDHWIGPAAADRLGASVRATVARLRRVDRRHLWRAGGVHGHHGSERVAASETLGRVSHRPKQAELGPIVVVGAGVVVD